MIAGPQHREVRERGGRHAAREKQRRVGAFEQREPPADVDLIGIVAVAAVEDFGGGSDRIRERGALVQRRGYGGPNGAGVWGALCGAGRTGPTTGVSAPGGSVGAPGVPV